MKKREVAPLTAPSRRVAPGAFPAGQSQPAGHGGIGRNSMVVPDGAPSRASRAMAAMLAVLGLGLPASAHASFLPPDMMDSAAMGLAWFIIVFVPIGGIVLFWLVHILPEKIAHKRHHPQRDAIQILCLLSLVFGGMLWPIAWLWAFTRPTSYRLAYGTDKHEDYYRDLAEKAQAGTLLDHELAHLREELDVMEAKGGLSAELKVLRRDLATARARPAEPVGASATLSGTGAKRGAA
jgi:Protein of unknown function (DUF3302)